MPHGLRVFAAFGIIGCASLPSASAHRSDYVDCLHIAMRGVVEGWVCVDDGQIAGAAFSGHVLYQNAAGSLSPVAGVVFWQGLADAAGAIGPLTRVDVEVGPDGWFSHPQLVHYSAGWRKKDGKLSATQQVEDLVFVLRAPGCRDYTVHFRPDDPDHIILMDCSAEASAEFEKPSK